MQNIKPTFTQEFVLVAKKSPSFKKTAAGRIQRRQEITLRCPIANEREGNHSVLFFDTSITHLENIEAGDRIELQFIIVAGISISGQCHTNMIPKAIYKK